MPIVNFEPAAGAPAQPPQSTRDAARNNAAPAATLDAATALQPSAVTQISAAGRLRLAQELQQVAIPEAVAASPVPEPRTKQEVAAPAESSVVDATQSASPRERQVVPESQDPAVAQQAAIAATVAPEPSAVVVNDPPPAEPDRNEPRAEIVNAPVVSSAVASAAPSVEAAAPPANPAAAPTPEAAFEPISPLLRQAANDFVAAFNAASAKRPPAFELVSVGRDQAPILSARVQSDTDVTRDNVLPVSATGTPPSVVAADSIFAAGVARIDAEQEQGLSPSNVAAQSDSQANDTQSLLRSEVARGPAAAPANPASVELTAARPAGTTSPTESSVTNAAPSVTPGTSGPVNAAPSTSNLARHLNNLANNLTP